MNVHEAFWFLYDHPKCIVEDKRLPLASDVISTTSNRKNSLVWWEGQFINSLDIMYVMVNPTTKSIDPNEDLNTEIRVWLESGPAMYEEFVNGYIGNVHDPALDCGGATFEEALINLAELVKTHYGDYDRETLKGGDDL